MSEHKNEDVILGTPKDDPDLNGTPDDDIIQGRGGDDNIEAGEGNDQISGGGDDDMIDGGGGDDTIDAGNGDDVVTSGYGNDTAYGGNGDDFFFLGINDGNDEIDGGKGMDTVCITVDQTVRFTITRQEDGSLIYNDDNGQTDIYRSIERIILKDEFGNILGEYDTTGNIDNAPYAGDDTPPDGGTVGQDGSLNVGAEDGVSANDFDIEGNNLPVTEVNGNADDVNEEIVLASGALFTLHDDGSYHYDPDNVHDGLAEGETFTETIEYTTSDGTNESTGTLRIVVAGINDDPTAGNVQAAASDGGGSIDGTFAGDDIDSDNNQGDLTYEITSDPSEGSVENNGDGTFTYDPEGDFQDLADGETRNATFEYTATDRYGAESNTGTVTVTVTGVNDNPTVNDVAAEAIEDGPTVIGNFDGDDVDSDDDPNTLTYAIVLSSGPSEGSVVNNSDGTFTFNPEGDFQDLAKDEIRNVSFQYIATDQHGADSNTGTVTVAVTGINDDPTAAAVAAETTEDGPLLSINLTGLATDPDTSDDLEVIDIDTTNTLGLAFIDFDNEGVVYDPHFSPELQSLAVGESTTDSFTYTIDDGNGGTDTATVSVLVTGQNDAPTTPDHLFTTTEDSSSSVVAFQFPGDDVDSDQMGFELDYALVGPIPFTVSIIPSLPDNRTDLFRITIADRYDDLAVGEFEDVTFQYMATDQHGAESDPGTITIRVMGNNDLPQNLQAVIHNDPIREGERGDIFDTIPNPIPNPTRPFIQLYGFEITEDENIQGYVVAEDRDNDAPPSLPLFPTPEDPDPPGLEYTIEFDPDNVGSSSTGSSAFTDVDGLYGEAGALRTITTWFYSAISSFDHLQEGEFVDETFTFTAADQHGAVSQRIVTIRVNGVNDLPVAEDDSNATDEDTALNVAAAVGVLANDTDPDDTLSVMPSNVTSALGAAVSIAADSSYTYDPTDAAALQALRTDELITDTFTYTVEEDAHDQEATATVSIEVTGINDAPVAEDADIGFVQSNGQLVIAASDLLKNVSDAEDDADLIPLTIIAVDDANLVGHDSIAISVNEFGEQEIIITTTTPPVESFGVDATTFNDLDFLLDAGTGFPPRQFPEYSDQNGEPGSAITVNRDDYGTEPDPNIDGTAHVSFDGKITDIPEDAVTPSGDPAPKSDQDWLKLIELKAGDTLILDVDTAGEADPVDTVISLWDSLDGMDINQQVDFSGGLGSAPLDAGSTSSFDPYLEYTVPTDGTYFVLVKGQADTVDGDYLLHVSITPAQPTAPDVTGSFDYTVEDFEGLTASATATLDGMLSA